jgi:tetratricopeptide (TPR) repeat protein
LELELVGRSELLWSSSSSSKTTTSDFKGQEMDDLENSVVSVAWNLYHRTNFIDLSSQTINAILNSYFILRLILIPSKVEEAAAATAAAAAKGKKGAPVVAESPDTILAEISFPLSTLFQERSGKINIQSSLESLQVNQPRTTVHSLLNAQASSLSLSLSLDNGLLEYIALGNILQVDYASIQRLPYEWCVPITIPVDKAKGAAKGKGKESPPSDELRNKEIQFITETLNNQSNLAQYTFTMSTTLENEENKTTSEEEEKKDEWVPFPTITLSDGRLDFNKENSMNFEVTEEEPIRNHPELWSLSWGPSPYVFFHRSVLKTFITQLQSGSYPSLQVTIKRLPSSVLPEPTTTKSKEPIPEPLSELTAQATLDIAQITQPDIRGITLVCHPVGQEIESSQPAVEIVLNFSNPFVVSSSFPPSDILPIDAISLKQVQPSILNRDVKKELRNEISLIVKEIAQEYVSLYPQPPAASSASTTNGVGGPNGGGESDHSSIEQRKGHFLYHLSTSGIYHRLKEILKPKIQRVVRERYGARNRALGKTENTIPSIGYEIDEKLPMEEMLSELYVMLVKECNTVLNAMYKSTIVSRDTEELEKCATIDDETETPQQKFYRLFCLCNDAEGDKRYDQAEQYHLERIQLLEYEILLNTDPQSPHHAYYQYYEYLIRRSVDELLSHLITNSPSTSSSSLSPSNPPLPESVQNLREKAMESLQQAITLKSTHWMSYLQLGCLLLEMNQIERSYDAFQTAISLQLNLDETEQQQQQQGDKETGLLNHFQGYESDKLCPIHPLTYVMLALYYSTIDQPLQTRKAIRLAVRSYQEGDYEPSVSTHGKPRRTAVLCLCQGAIFLYEHGYITLGNICTQYALDCEIAATKKAQERNLSAETVPFIRHLLKKSQCYSYLFTGDLQSAYRLAQDCYAVSVSPSDLIQSNLCITKVCSYMTSHAAAAAAAGGGVNGDGSIISPEESQDISISAYLRILKEAQKHNFYSLIPLEDYLNLGKLLIVKGRYQDALEAMLHGCRLYPSSSLFNLIGLCCLRLDKMIDAEDALQEANLIDNCNPSVWGYLCVLCLSTGGHRLEEADNCCYQSLRLGLLNPLILREMSMAYIAVDKLILAEELLRRVIFIEEKEYGKCSSYTRRLLGDVLAGQNQAAQAIEEYQLIIEEEETEIEMRIQAGEKCMKLLESLGRTEELITLESILRSLSGEE